MFKNYFTIAWRNLVRNKIFSMINIVGLAIGLTVCFLIFEYVAFESSYDSFNAKASRIFRVTLENVTEVDAAQSATNHPAVGMALQADYPEVKASARLVPTSLLMGKIALNYEKTPGNVVTFNEENTFLADQAFLTIFSFPLLEGDAATALKEPLSIVITERTARKYFGNQSALGKQINANRQANLKVTGVLKDLPENSHLAFDILISFSTLGNDKYFADTWTWPGFYNYIELAPGTNASALQAKLPAFCNKYLGKVMKDYNWKISMHLQPVTDIHLTSHLQDEQSVNGNDRTVYFLTLLAIFVLVIAWINYINLSTAKSMERSKEVGIRKTAGARKSQLVIQFFFDAFLVNTIALSVAVMLLAFATPLFESIVGKHFSDYIAASGMLRTFSFWGAIAAFLCVGTAVIGLYPALLLSSFNPAVVLKGRFYKSSGGIRLRQGMVAFQYVLSVLLIAGTIALYRQLSYMQNSDLGYAKDQVLILKMPAVRDSTFQSKVEHFKSQMGQLSSVASISASSEIPGRRFGGNGVRRFGEELKANKGASYMGMDNDFLKTYDLPLAAGRNFEPTDRTKDRAEATRVMINEVLSNQLGYAKPEDAVGRQITYGFGPDEHTAEVVGVIKNYHQLSLQSNYTPTLYLPENSVNWDYFSLRLSTKSLPETLEQIRKTYDATFSFSAFDYFFLDDFFNKQYASDEQLTKLFGVFTGLAILISCMGLLGLSIFAITHRTKEIGIRKVLGAPVASILVLFSRDSVKLLLISYVLAAPICYFAIDKWLQSFTFRMNIGWEIFLVPPAFLLVISVSTIAVVCFRAALANPTRALKHE